MAARINELKEARIHASKALNALLDEQSAAKAALGDAYALAADGKDAPDAAALEARAKACDGQVSAARKHLTLIDEQIHAEQQRIDADLAAALAAPRRVETYDNREDRPWAVGKAGLGEWAMACLRAAQGHGADPRLFHAAATGMGGLDPATGGYAVPIEQATEIQAAMFSQGQILSLVDARDITGDRVVYSILKSETSRADGYRQGGVVGYWVDAGEAPTASSIKLARLEMNLKKLGALGYLTDELMADAAALGGELQAAFTEELLFKVESAIWEGTGAGTPLGILKAPCWSAVAIETGQTLANGAIVPANITKMWQKMPPRLKASANWFVTPEASTALDSMALPVGTAALEPRFVNYGPDGILRIKGRPVIEIEYASALGTVGDIVLANFSQYRLIRKAGGVQQASSIHVLFTQGETAFRAFFRCDGQPVPRGTIAAYKGSITYTPFIGLAVRS
jgi:HK97 family phage major capsid protein